MNFYYFDRFKTSLDKNIIFNYLNYNEEQVYKTDAHFRA